MRATAKILLLGVFLVTALWPAAGMALQTDFRGHIVSTAVVRDTSGFQHGFMDDLEVVQWRNELKFDLSIRPDYISGQPAVRLEKVFLVYRGAWDAIFDLTDRYDDIRYKGASKFDLGKEDLIYENDLREIFADFVAEGGSQLANLRLGRQIIQWGDADGFNLANILNPNDNSTKMFFANPEDIAIPLWMMRLDYTVQGVGPFDNLSLQLVGIPDIRPNQFAPLDGKYNAPYAFAFAGFAPLAVHENVAERGFENMEIGVRLGFQVGSFLGYFYFFDGYQDAMALDMRTAEATGAITADHPRQKVYAASFSTFLPQPINGVLRGEASLTDKQAFFDLEPMLTTGGPSYSMHSYYQFLIGFDRDYHPPIGTKTALTTAVQFYYQHINDWEYDADLRSGTKADNFRLTFLATTNYMHGSLTPTLFLMYDFEGNLMSNLSINYTPDGQWFFEVQGMAFWGDKDNISAFAPLVSTSEVSFRVGWRF